MKGLFQDATSFNQDLRSWKLNEKLPKSRTMFTGATAFKTKEHSPFLNIKAKKEIDAFKDAYEIIKNISGKKQQFCCKKTKMLV